MIRTEQISNRFWKDERGVSVIELALALPVMIMMLIGFMDVTMAFSNKTQVQQIAQSGAEIVIANIVDVPTDDVIKTELASMSGLPETAFAIRRWTECDFVAQAAVKVCPTGVAEEATYLELTVTDTYQPVLGDVGLGELGPKDLIGSVTVRIE